MPLKVTAENAPEKPKGTYPRLKHQGGEIVLFLKAGEGILLQFDEDTPVSRREPGKFYASLNESNYTDYDGTVYVSNG